MDVPVETTTTINCGGAKIIVKNYNSINVAGTLAFSNPSTNGTIVILKSLGNVTISGTINLKGMGAAAATNGWGYFQGETYHGRNGETKGKTVPGGSQYLTSSKYYNEDIYNLYGIVIATGSGGGNGSDEKSDYFPTGGSGAGSVYGAGGDAPDNADGAAGNGYGAGGAGGAASSDAGGRGYWFPLGGRGGGAILVKCRGDLDFTGTIDVSGEDGQDGYASNEASGAGGGAAGMAILVYNGSLVNNTGTINSAGGAGGTESDGVYVGGDGGASSGGLIYKYQNFFING